MIEVHNKTSLIGTRRRYWLYRNTPRRLDAAVTKRTLPKNSGPNPMSLVMKYSIAPSDVGVAFHRKRKRTGL